MLGNRLAESTLVRTPVPAHGSMRHVRWWAALCLLLLTAGGPWAAGGPIDVHADPVFIRVDGLAGPMNMTPYGVARRTVVKAFLDDHPNYTIETFSMPRVQGQAGDSGPLMAIAAGIPPHAIYVNFRQSSTYISQGFLDPIEVLLARLESNNGRVREVDRDGRWLADPTPDEIARALGQIRRRTPAQDCHKGGQHGKSQEDCPYHRIGPFQPTGTEQDSNGRPHQRENDGDAQHAEIEFTRRSHGPLPWRIGQHAEVMLLPALLSHKRFLANRMPAVMGALSFADGISSCEPESVSLCSSPL